MQCVAITNSGRRCARNGGEDLFGWWYCPQHDQAMIKLIRHRVRSGLIHPEESGLIAPPKTAPASSIRTQARIDRTDTCKWCDQPIFLIVGSEGGTWFHDDPDRSRGCRTASWTDETGHNEALDPQWRATPSTATRGKRPLGMSREAARRQGYEL